MTSLKLNIFLDKATKSFALKPKNAVHTALLGDKLHWLPRRDDVRTLRPRSGQAYAAGKHLGWHLLGKEILLHVRACDIECPQVEFELNDLLVIVSEYQREAV